MYYASVSGAVRVGGCVNDEEEAEGELWEEGRRADSLVVLWHKLDEERKKLSFSY
jgi:hypothetical protein